MTKMKKTDPTKCWWDREEVELSCTVVGLKYYDHFAKYFGSFGLY
jgi:hypothetical protein